MPEIIKALITFFTPKLREAAPGTPDQSFSSLIIHKDGRLLGSLIPEIFVSALHGKTRVQIEEKEWRNTLSEKDRKKEEKIIVSMFKEQKPALFEKLYQESNPGEWKRKDPRDLARDLAFSRSDNNIVIENIYKKHIQYLKKKGISFPPFISKLRILSDILESDIVKNAKQLGLTLTPVSLKANINNKKPTTLEHVVHYTGQWAAWLVTLVAWGALVDSSIWAALVDSPFWAGLVGLLGIPATVASSFALSGVAIALLAVWLRKVYGEYFGFYDTAELMLRELNHFKSKDAWRIKKFNLVNTVKTVAVLLALSFGAYCAADAALDLTLGLSVWKGLVAYMHPQLIHVLSYMVGGATAVFAGIQTVVFGTFGARFFLGLGCHDDHKVNLTQEKVNTLTPNNPGKAKSDSRKAKEDYHLGKVQSSISKEESLEEQLRRLSAGIKSLNDQRDSLLSGLEPTKTPANDATREPSSTKSNITILLKNKGAVLKPKGSSSPTEKDVETSSSSNSNERSVEKSSSEGEQTKRGRGRPPKRKGHSHSDQSSSESSVEKSDEKKRRGRPKKGQGR